MILLQVFHNIQSSDSHGLASIIFVIIILWILCDGDLTNIFGHRGSNQKK